MIEELAFVDTFSDWKNKLNGLINSHNTDSATLNELKESGDDGQAFTYNKKTSSGLVINVNGGRVRSGSVVETIADKAITLPANSVRVLAIYKIDGVAPSLVLYAQDALPEKYIIPVGIFTTNASAVTAYSDLRTRYSTASGTTSASSGVLQFDKLIDLNLTVPPEKNALSVSPTVAEGITVTVSEGSTWVVL